MGLALIHLVHKNPDLDFLTSFKFLIIHIHLSRKMYTLTSTENILRLFNFLKSLYGDSTVHCLSLGNKPQNNVPGTLAPSAVVFWSLLS